MNKTFKIIISLVVALIVIIFIVLLFKGRSVSSTYSDSNIDLDSSTNSDVSATGTILASNNTSTSTNQDSSIQNTPPPQDDSANSDIDTYLQTYRTDTQPDSNDFNDPYSDLK